MTGVFEVLAADQSDQIVAGRKAVALATKRVNERFGKFLLGSQNRSELGQRLGYIEADLNGVIAVVQEETGYENPKLAQSIINSFYDRFPAQVRTASVHEARRPKLCPYHKEVVDVSLAEGSPRAGFDSMAQHAFGPKHCDGEYDGSCSFRREMTTQSWWDERDKALEERREERERTQQEPILEAPITEEPSAVATEGPEGELDEPVSEGTEELTEIDAPLAEVPMAMAASLRKEAPGNQHVPGASPKRNRQYEHIKQNCLDEGKSEERCKELAARTVNKQRSEHGETKSGGAEHLKEYQFKKKDAEETDEPEGEEVEKTAEAVKTIDVGQKTGPSPKMDKRKWTPDNLADRVETESEGNPNPTHKDDVLEPRHVENNDGVYNSEPLKQIGENTTERVKLPSSEDAGFTTEKNVTAPSGSQWTGTDGLATPVTPKGFVSSTRIESALRGRNF